jgi:hypothetical protein
LLQSRNGAVHATPHAPALHVLVPFAGPGHGWQFRVAEQPNAGSSSVTQSEPHW